jgi:hypothetical protein
MIPSRPLKKKEMADSSDYVSRMIPPHPQTNPKWLVPLFIEVE